MPKKNTVDYTSTINDILVQMEGFEADSKEYERMVHNLDVLTKAKAAEAPEKLSINTILTVSANILGILLILNHEQLNVISTKAFNFIPKAK